MSGVGQNKFGTPTVSLNGLKKPLTPRKSSKKAASDVKKTVPAEPKPPEIDIPRAQEVIFKPNPGPQTQFLSSSEQEVLYGGAGGGGKSYAMVADPVRYFNNPLFKGLLVRRTTEELRELISVSKQLFPKAIPGIKWSERERTWITPQGASLWMSYLESEDDVLRYQGQAFSWIGFDELTQWPSPYQWNYMRSRLRTTTASGLKLYQRACVDEGDVLTESGWKDIKNVAEGELVYSLLSDGTLTLKKVTGVHIFDVEEPLVRVRKKNLYMSMTPDHRVLYRKQNSHKFELIRFNEHKSLSIDIARTSTGYEAKGYKSPIAGFSDLAYAEFLGLYVAEGCVCKPRNGNYKVLVTQNKIENQPWVRSVMEASGLTVCYCNNGDFQITNKALHEHLAPLGKAHQKHFPREFLLAASKEQLKVAFKAYTRGDGNWQSDSSCQAVTCSRQLASDLQEIAVKLGYKVQVTHTKHENVNHNDRFTVYLTKNSPTTRVDKDLAGRNDVTLQPYSGKVYCLSVEDTENFVIRQQDFVWVSGNTTNPGGPGHAWVKKMFVDPAPPNTAFWATDPDTGEVLSWPKGHSREGQPLFRRRFIPATLFDNPYLAEDGLYEANLLSLPEHQKRQLLYGDWDINEGAAFPEFNRNIHVIEPFDIPASWPRFRAADYGYGSYSGVLWFAVSPSEQLIVYREMFVSKVTAWDLADLILDAEVGEKIRFGVLDSSLWHNRGDRGPSLAEQMISKGCRWRPSDRSKGSRVAGKNEIHRRLQVDEYTGEPQLVFFSTCTNVISQLPSLPLDKNNPEDVNTNSEDHLYDALRYGVMSRPRSGVFDYDPTRSKGFKPADVKFGY